jgi:hypothetical protein
VNRESLWSAFLMAILIAGSVLAGIMGFGTAQASTGVNGVPDFTLRYVDYSYDVPPKTTSTTDPYTNETTTTTIPGRHVDNKTVEAVIRNNVGASYYNFRYKGHYAEEWRYYPFDPDSRFGYSLPDAFYVPYKASDSSFTVAALPFYSFKNVPAGGLIDVQVQALFGDFDADPWGHLLPMEPTYDFDFTGTTSDWSSTQTITIGEGQAPTPSPATTPTPAPTATAAPSPIPVPGQSYFFVESNSTVLALFFNSSSAELSFTVSGEKGTAGYVEITIAKSLVSNVQDIKAYLDGNELSVAITSNEDSWLLSFTYMHSTHNVKINLAANAAAKAFMGIEYWMWISIAVIAVVVGAGLLVYFRCRRDHAALGNAEGEVETHWTK